MWKPLAALQGLMTLCCATAAADLLPAEERWLAAAWPVIAHAQALQMPLDIVVQPQPAPGLAPLALAFVDGRCKLVLSLRGNPLAGEAEARIDHDLFDATLELMAAHELGHCRRWLDGAWHGVPAGFSPAVPSHLPASKHAAWARMQATRLEEAYGDLVGLAWVQRERPAQYDRLHAWLLRERATGLPEDHHDTRPWLQLVAEGRTLAGPTLFARPDTLWRQGLAAVR